MKKLLLALVLTLFLIPTTPASAQCTGVFQANTVCGVTGTEATRPPHQISFTAAISAICTISPSTCTSLLGYTNVTWYGAICDGVTNDATAIAAASTAISASGGKLVFPPGICVSSTVQTTNVPTDKAVTLAGAGSGVSKVLFTSSTANGFVINQGSGYGGVHIEGLSIITNKANSGAGLTLTNTVALGFAVNNTLLDVTVSGDVAAGTHYWTSGIVTTNVSFINLTSVNIYGSSSFSGTTCYTYQGTAASSKNSIIANVSKSNFIYCGIGVYYGDWAQGLTIDQTNFQNGTTGVFTSNVTSGGTGDQLAITSSQFGGLTAAAIQTRGITAVIAISNNTIFTADATTSIALQETTSQFTISGNTIAGAGSGSTSRAISVGGVIGIIEGNVIENQGIGITLEATSTNVTAVQGANKFYNNGVDISNLGAASNNTVFQLDSGGTNNSLTASNGGIVWSDASKLNIVAGTATARLPLLSGAFATPVWGAFTLPSSVTSGGVPYFSSTSVMGSSALLASGSLMTGGGAGNPPVTIILGGDCTFATPNITCAKVNGISFPSSVTSGGVLYASSTSAIASSALLTANAIMIGGGAGVAPSTTATGTGVLTALGVNVGSAGAFVTFNGALGTPSSGTLTNATGLPTTGLTGTLQAAQEPAHTGDVTNSAGSLALVIGATKVTSAMLNADVFSTAHSWGGQQTFTAPILGTPASGTVTNLTGTASININGTVGATTPTTGAFTSITGTSVNSSTASGYSMGTVAALQRVAIYTLLFDDTGTNRVLSAGNATDPSNYADNTTHFLRSRGGGTTYLNVGAAGLGLNVLSSDTATTDATLCARTSDNLVLKGTGALGICLGTSGAQFKTAFAPMTAGLDEVARLHLQNYRYLKGYGDGGDNVQFGLTAQDVDSVLPTLVRHDAKGEAINYDSGALLFIGLKAIQELKAANDNLRVEIEALKKASK